MVTIDASVWVSGLEKKDSFYTATTEFLLHLDTFLVRSYTPSFALVEIACALNRRTRDPLFVRDVIESLQEWSLLTIFQAEYYLPEVSIQRGVEFTLRAGDATYAATAYLTGTQLVTWDQELLERANGVMPSDWLSRHS